MTTTRAAPAMADALIVHVALQLDEVAKLLEEQHANPFRIQAYSTTTPTASAREACSKPPVRRIGSVRGAATART